MGLDTVLRDLTRIGPGLGVPSLVASLLTGSAVQGALAGGLGPQLLGLYLAFVIGWVLLTLQLAFIYRAFATSRPSTAAVAWGSTAAASSLAGMSLGWLPILRLGVDIGRAYGGSEMLGRQEGVSTMTTPTRPRVRYREPTAATAAMIALREAVAGGPLEPEVLSPEVVLHNDDDARSRAWPWSSTPAKLRHLAPTGPHARTTP